MKLYKRTIKLNGKRVDREFEGIFTDLELAKAMPPEFFDTYGNDDDDVLHVLILETTADQAGADFRPVHKSSWALRDTTTWGWDNYYTWEALNA